MSIDTSMNETPSYTQFNFQNEEDLSFGMFDVAGAAANHPGFHHHHQSMQSDVYGDAFSLHAQPSPSGAGHMSAQHSPFGFIPRTLVGSYDETVAARPPTPYLAHAKFESPGLSNGSSSTPETNESQQLLVTPKNASATRHVAGDDVCGIEGEEEEEFDDDPFPLLSSSSSGRDKAGGRRQRQRTTTTTMSMSMSQEIAVASASGSGTVGNDPGPGPGPGRGGEKEGKRRHFLQRNRVAAMKCRKKKKEWVNDLEETKTGLESQNTHLHMELDGLVGEASRIRAQLMVHANCNDANIDKWIENEAKRFVIGTGERYDQILAGNAQFGQQQQQEGAQGMMPSSSSAGSEYHAAAGGGGGGGAGGPNLISPLATPSSQVPPSPAFYTPNAAPGCYGVPPHEAARFAQGLGQRPAGDEEPDYDGMSMSMYDHAVS